MRTDVRFCERALSRDLDTLQAKVLATDGLRWRPTHIPGLLEARREADGEHYVYVSDAAQRELVGLFVFNRLVEVRRSIDPWVRSPHAKVRPAYRGKGLARATYQSMLRSGLCLVSGARQSPSAHALWHALSTDHELGVVEIADKRLRPLRAASATVLDQLQTRLILYGDGWDAGRVLAEGQSGTSGGGRNAQPDNSASRWTTHSASAGSRPESGA